MSYTLLKLPVVTAACVVTGTACWFAVRPLFKSLPLLSRTKLMLSLGALTYLLSVLSFLRTGFQSISDPILLPAAVGGSVTSYGLCCIAKGLDGPKAGVQLLAARSALCVGIAAVVLGIGFFVAGAFGR